MSNLIDRDSILADYKKIYSPAQYIEFEKYILSIPLQQGEFSLGYCDTCMQMTNHKLECQKCKTRGNEKIKELIEKKIKMCKRQIGQSDRHFGGMVVCEQLLSEIDNPTS